MKSSVFNLSRFSDYLRKDWAENGILHLLHFVLIYAGLTLLFYLTDAGKTLSVSRAIDETSRGVETRNNSYLSIMDNATQGIDTIWNFITGISEACFCIFLAFTGSTFCKNTKRRKSFIADLTTPVSTLEKFSARWLRIAVAAFPLYWVAAILADLTRVWLIHVLYPDLSLSYPVPWFEHMSMKNILHAYCIQSMCILCSTYWRKKPFPKTIIALLLLCLFYFAILSGNVYFFIGEDFDYHNATQRWLNGWTTGIEISLLLFCYALSYIRMQQASLIVSWKDKTTKAILVVFTIGVVLCLWMPHFIVSHFSFN